MIHSESFGPRLAREPVLPTAAAPAKTRRMQDKDGTPPAGFEPATCGLEAHTTPRSVREGKGAERQSKQGFRGIPAKRLALRRDPRSQSFGPRLAHGVDAINTPEATR